MIYQWQEIIIIIVIIIIIIIIIIKQSVSETFRPQWVSIYCLSKALLVCNVNDACNYM